MDLTPLAGDHRADLFGAKRDDRVDMFKVDRFDALGPVGCDVDSDFFHRADRQRVQARGLRSRALDLHLAPEPLPSQPFGHLAAGGVAHAQE